MKVTPYDDINQVLDILSKEVKEIFDKDLIGLYLTGSLSYGDFNMDRSDIDLLVVLKKAVSDEQLKKLKKKYERLKIIHPKWAERLECSYISIDILKDILPPLQPRPYYGEGELYLATYGNEWLINNYLLYKYGIALIGPDFKTLMKPIDIKEVQKACVRDLFKEWEPKII
ncbi:MAG: nucleotidyltransferase domain-containing protein, partial [bacterium]|nr:nucleotidyltransferase domain-containing protein [bacterium]